MGACPFPLPHPPCNTHVHARTQVCALSLPHLLAAPCAAEPGGDGQAVGFSPELACMGCPTRDARQRVNDTGQPPYEAVGMLMRSDRDFLSQWVAGRAVGGGAAVCLGVGDGGWVGEAGKVGSSGRQHMYGMVRFV